MEGKVGTKDGAGSKVEINKRLLYFFAFLFILIPVLVGTLVWHFTSKDNEKSGGPTPTSSRDAVSEGSGGGSTHAPSGTTTTHAPSPQEIARQPWLALLLPDSQEAVHYDITLYPDFYDGQGSFYGNETVEIEIKRKTKFLLIHVFEKLDVTEVSLLDNVTKNEVEVSKHFYYAPHQFLVVEAVRELDQGQVVQLRLQFNGSLTESIVGFYKSSYVNSKTNETRYLATSKFEPVSARRAFPCMDEPSLKAEYTVTLVHRPDYTALSNMPPVGDPTPSEVGDGLVATRFERSVKMSTYLVCFIVCDFNYTEDFTASGTRVRVYATPDKMDQTQYALEMGVHTMEEYERLFNISYPLPKQDMIAIPDFVSGAMEHWGLITYREVNLLYDPQKASAANKQRVATVVAHEISHQWFGNLVTMAWWNDLWLNEGFASFMEYVGVETKETDWDMLSQFVVEDQQPVMVTDAGVSSHPIVVNVISPDEINEVFDSISYSKGASVIRMMEAMMGKDKFFEGVSRYLKMHKWGNAKTDQLWNALTEVADNLDVKHVMDTWTLQMGFPFVNLTLTPQNGGRAPPKVTAKQTRFLADPGAQYNVSESPFNYKWYISLDCLTSTGSKTKHVLDLAESVTFNLEDYDPNNLSHWFKCNLDQTGFYRVNYPPDNWRALAYSFKSTYISNWTLTAADRAGLIDDAMSLAGAGLLGYDVALEMTSYLNRENHFVPWQSVFSALTYISNMLYFDADFNLWRNFVLDKVTPSLDRLGWVDGGNHLERRLRGLVIDLACRHYDPNCLSNATLLFRDWLDNGTDPPLNLRSLVYKWGMWAGGSAADWEELWQRYKREVVPQEKINLLRALAMTKSPWLLARLLEYTKAGEDIRRQDFIVVVQLIAVNPAARSQLWDWVRRNWEAFVDRFTLFDRYFGRVIPYTTANFNTRFDKEQVEEFFQKYPEAGAGARGRKQALERIDQNIYWMEHFKPTVVQWLKTRNP